MTQFAITSLIVLFAVIVSVGVYAKDRDKFPGRRQGGGTHNTEQVDKVE